MPPFPAARGTGRIDRCDHGAAKRSRQIFKVHCITANNLLQLLEDIRKNNNITNADLCNKFADEIYLPKIVLKKADIPLSLRSQFIDLR